MPVYEVFIKNAIKAEINRINKVNKLMEEQNKELRKANKELRKSNDELYEQAKDLYKVYCLEVNSSNKYAQIITDTTQAEINHVFS